MLFKNVLPNLPSTLIGQIWRLLNFTAFKKKYITRPDYCKRDYRLKMCIWKLITCKHVTMDVYLWNWPENISGFFFFWCDKTKKGKDNNNNNDNLSFSHDKNCLSSKQGYIAEYVFCKVAAARLSVPLTENRKECFKLWGR